MLAFLRVSVGRIQLNVDLCGQLLEISPLLSPVSGFAVEFSVVVLDKGLLSLLDLPKYLFGCHHNQSSFIWGKSFRRYAK